MSLQVLLCTATMPQAVAAAASEWLRKPADCCVRGGDGAAAISPTVTQVHEVEDSTRGPHQRWVAFCKVCVMLRCAQGPTQWGPLSECAAAAT